MAKKLLHPPTDLAAPLGRELEMQISRKKFAVLLRKVDVSEESEVRIGGKWIERRISPSPDPDAQSPPNSEGR